MTISHDSTRGEIPLTIGDVEIAVAADIHKLAAVSTRLGCQSFSELYQKVVGVEPNALMVAVEMLAVKGDGAKAAKQLKISDLRACSDAFSKAFLFYLAPANDGADTNEAAA